MNQTGKGLRKFDYVVGKSKTLEGAESLQRRTDDLLRKVGTQRANVTRIANGSGQYGYRVNVTSEVAK